MQTAMKTSDMLSVPKTACNQIGTQPEVTRNTSSTSKHWYQFRNVISPYVTVGRLSPSCHKSTQSFQVQNKQIRDTKTKA